MLCIGGYAEGAVNDAQGPSDIKLRSARRGYVTTQGPEADASRLDRVEPR